jgi:tetratricopeptide (TPR) repeat protein
LLLHRTATTPAFAAVYFLRRCRLLFTLLTLPLAPAPALQAHGNDQIVIDALSEAIEKAPDPDLLIRRGELFRHHQEWAKAEADFVAAARLDPSLAILDLFRARARLEAGDPGEALPLAERYVAGHADDPDGWFLRGEILAALDRPGAAAADYAEGIQRTARPRSEHYLRRAQLLATTAPGDHAPVLKVLEEGITRCGPVISLVDFALSLDLQQQNYARALERVDVALAHAPRRELWLVRRAEVLRRSGRISEAVTGYRTALAAIDDLPPRIRDTVPMEKLVRDARAALEQLSSQPP